MIVESELLVPAEFLPFERALVDQVAFPLGDRYPPEIFDRYFFVYSGLVFKYRPARILEIGVRYGYTGAVFCYAALVAAVREADRRATAALQPGAGQKGFSLPRQLPVLPGELARVSAELGDLPVVEYVGLDDESYHSRSCVQANANLDLVVGSFAQARAFKHNSFEGLPGGIGTFDLIHVDGNHSTKGVLNDLGICWPVLNPGGIVVLDDYYFPEIKLAIDQWVEAKKETEEQIEVQFVESERGHYLIRKVAC